MKINFKKIFTTIIFPILLLSASIALFISSFFGPKPEIKNANANTMIYTPIPTTSIILPKQQVLPFLDFPLAKQVPFKNGNIKVAGINSVFDHSTLSSFAQDGKVVAFTGDEGNAENPGSEEVNTPAPGYTNKTNTNFDFKEKAYYRAASEMKKLLFYDGHLGYDYQSEFENIYAPADGTIYVPTEDKINGNPQIFNTVVIDHGNGYETWYLHLDKVYKKEGKVKRGELFGVTGKTGTAFPHLHFELRFKGVPIDPYGWNPSKTSVVQNDPYTLDNDILNDPYYTKGQNFWTGKTAK